MLLVRLLDNSRLSVVKSWGSLKLHGDFQLCEGLVILTPMLFNSQLCLENRKIIKYTKKFKANSFI